MPKNILIFSDGTGQAGGVRPDQRLSNVYKLYRASRAGPDSPVDPKEQVAFYDAGLGTDDDARGGLIQFGKFLRKTLASVTGRGITRNVTDCYEAILNEYEPGDRIFLFGFSRGAYTARCVAGVLALCGVPTLGRDGRPMPRHRIETRSIADEAVRKVYEHGAGKPAAEYGAQREELGRRFRAKYGSDVEGGCNVAPYFIGVFDTVASLGSRGIIRVLLGVGLVLGTLAMCWALAGAAHAITNIPTGRATLALFMLATAVFAWSSLRSTLHVIRNFPNKGDFSWHIAKWHMKNYDRGLSHNVHFARHALSIDETRADFPRVQWGFLRAKHDPVEGEPEWFQQIWFAGNHSDIGGSYPEEESRLSDTSLGWMLEQATSLPHPLLVDGVKLKIFPSPDGMQHCEVDATRDNLSAYLPSWWPESMRPTWKEHPRIEVLGAPVHASVPERFALPVVLKCGRFSAYRPETLRTDERFSHFYDQQPTEADS